MRRFAPLPILLSTLAAHVSTAVAEITFTAQQSEKAQVWLSEMEAHLLELRNHRHGGTHMQFLLQAAGDGDNAYMKLHHRDSHSTLAGFVPAWNQDTFNGGYGFHYRNGGGSLLHQRHFFSVSLNTAEIAEDRIHLKGTWQVKRNRWHHERLPPEKIRTLPGMPTAYSNYDAHAPEAHVRPRPLPFDMTLQPEPGRYWLDLNFSGLADGRAVSLQSTWPPQADEPTAVSVLRFNSAPHWADLQALTIQDQGVQGELKLVINPDRWVPKDKKQRSISIPVSLSADTLSSIDTTYKATVNGQPVQGRLTGSITPLWSGIYSAGDLTGRSFGGRVPVVAQRKDSTASLISQFSDLWIRAAYVHERTQVPSGLMAPEFSSAEEALAWMKRLHAHCLHLSEEEMLPEKKPVPRGAKQPSNPAGGPGTWKHPDVWHTYGPLAEFGGIHASARPVLPPYPVQPGETVHYHQSGLTAHGIARPRKTPSWGKVEPQNGFLLPHFFESSMYIPRIAPIAWQAVATIPLEEDADVVLRVECGDAGQLYVNGKRVFTSDPQDLRLHQTRLYELTVPMKAGENEVVWAVRADYARTWATLQYAVSPPTADPVQVETPRNPSAPRNLTQTVWRHEHGFRKSEPAVRGDHIALLTADGALAIRNLSDGEQLWKSDSLVIGEEKASDRHAKPLPVAKGWVAHINNGKIAAFTAEGVLRWDRPLHMTDVTLIEHEDTVIAVGRPVLGRTAKGKKKKMPRGVFLYAASAFKLEDGSVIWEKEFAGNGRPSTTRRGKGGGPSLYQNWTQHIAWLEQGDHAALLVRGGVVLDPATGEERLPHLDSWVHGECYWTVWGNWLFASSHSQLIAFTWGFDPEGTFLHQEVWRVRNELSSFGNSPSTVTSDGQYVYHHRPIPEHAPHCPALWTALDVHELETGNPVHELRPLFTDAEQFRYPIQIGIAGEQPLAFFQDNGGGTYAKDHRGEIAVFAMGSRPGLLHRWKSDSQLDVPPVLTAKGLLIRERTQLTLLTEGPHNEQTREAVLEQVGPVPPNAISLTLESEGELQQAEQLKTKLTPSSWRIRWTEEGSWQPLPREILHVYASANKGLLPFSSYNLQGRGVSPLIHQAQLDIGKLFQGQEGKSVELESKVYVPRDRAVQLSGLAPGIHATIGGHQIVNGQKLYLKQGAHTLLLRVTPAFFEHGPRFMPINQQAAIQAGRLKAVPTPEWAYYAPFPETTNLTADQRNRFSTDGKLTLNKQTWLPHILPITKEYRWLSPLMVLESDQPYQTLKNPQNSFAPGVIYATSSYSADEDGHVVVHASADWYMTWWVNGEEVYTTNGRGNGRGPEDVQAHTIVAPVKKGINQIVVRIQSGSKGIGLASRWSFTTENDFDALATTFPHPKGVPPPQPNLRISPRFTTLPDPVVARQNWIENAEPYREELQSIAVSDSPSAPRAKAALRALPK